MSNYIDEFRNSAASARIAGVLQTYNGKQLKIMEVCGTHTMAIFRYGIRELLPDAVKLVSGPGCPVCVTPVSYIDAAVTAARREDVIITTFGDLIRVPGSTASLSGEKANGADVRIVYSPLDALAIARENPAKKVVFLSVGFETTTPVSALTVLKAFEENIHNFFILPANKTMPEALKLLAADSDTEIDGYLYPGHVSAIIGTEFYGEIAEQYGIPGVVAGFEPLDILHAILTMLELCQNPVKLVVNEYSRFVKKEGNPLAVEKMYEVFEAVDSVWRGLGSIPGSGLAVRSKYEEFDAWKAFGLSGKVGTEPKGCRCGEVLKGRVVPVNCGLFGNTCTPDNPVGACMVSSEGTCAAYYRYNKA